jgi:hypothetical protein
MRCEAGAFFDERARLHYVCDHEAQVEVIYGDTVLIVYCAEHAHELYPDWMRRPGIQMRVAERQPPSRSLSSRSL